MHFAVNKQHRDFFRNNHWIECEEVLTLEELNKISQRIAPVLRERLQLSNRAADITKQSPNQIFSVGRDIWRGDAFVKKIVLGRALAGIAGELTEQRPLRIGYDMLLPSYLNTIKTNDSYENLLKNTPTLMDISAIQGVICGAMLCISAPTVIPEQPSELFSQTPGSVVFFDPNWPLPLPELAKHQGGLYLMVVYVNAKAVYLRQEHDPHLHALKQLGYQFGDRLTDVLNPIVYP